IDCGATSLIGLKRDGIDRNAIETILISHFHADHFGGLPFFVLDAQLVAKRKTPLRVIGPRGVEARFRAARDVAFPSAVEPRFALSFDEIAPGETIAFGSASVSAFGVVHTEAAGPCLGFRVAAGDKTLAFSGDTEWTDALIDIGRDADLFVCEGYTRDKKVRHHLDLAALERQLPNIAPRRLVLTHMSDDMLASRAGLPYETAYDGFVVTI
ncbi:MAG: MBL fold metallo-hydrolase, partial [Burkholderiales bacterium]|nr:MBL fold metallo-hydrolase [Burkholderiales bacterium]